MLSPRWRKVARDLWDNKSRTILVVMSIAVGVIAFGGLFTSREIMLNNLSASYNRSNPYDIAIDLPPFDDALVRWASRRDAVSGAQGQTIYAAELLVGREEFDITLYSFGDYDAVRINRIAPEAGSWPPALDEIAFERSYLYRLRVQPGDEVTIRLADDRTYTLTYTGTIHDVNAPSGRMSDQIVAYVSPRTLFRMGLSADYNRLQLTVNRSSQSMFAPDLNEIADDLRDELRGRGIEVRALRVETDKEHWATDTLGGIITVLVIIGFLSLLLSGFLVVNTISGLIAQQKRQIGMMKIIGASRAQIITLYLVMAACFGLLALVIALPASTGLAWGLSNFLGPGFVNFDIDDFRIPTYILAIQVGVGFVTPLLAALFPVLGGTSITAAEAISDRPSGAGGGRLEALLARIRGLPRPALLSLRNLFRKKARLALTLITLVLAGAFFIAALNVRAAMQRDVSRLTRLSSYDVRINFATPYEARGMERRALDIEGVAAVESWLRTNVSRERADGTRGAEFGLYGIPQNSVFINPEMNDGSWLGSADNPLRRDLVISDEILVDEPDLKVGDTIRLHLGAEEADWRIIGIVDANGFSGDAAIAYSYYDAVVHFQKSRDVVSSLMVRTTEPTRTVQTTVQTALNRYFDDRDIDVSSSRIGVELTQSVSDGLNVVTGLLLLTAVMIAVVGGLGLTGTMSLNVLERTREIGVMRSVGASNITIQSIFILEGVLIGLLSSVIAYVVSFAITAAFSAVLGQAMLGRPWTYTVTMLGPALWLVIILVISAAASIMPAQRAAQISIREALAYE